MRALSIIGLLLGAAICTALLRALPAGTWRALLAIGAKPLIAASVYRLVGLALYARSWQVLLPPATRPRFASLLLLRWVGESINTLLPAAQVGGDLVRARLLTRRGVSGAAAATALLGDLLTATLSQAVFTTLGMVALGAGAGLGSFAPAIATGLALLTTIALGLVMIMHLGRRGSLGRARPAWLARRLAGSGRTSGEEMIALDLALATLGRRRGALASAFAWHLAGWLSQVGETWLVLALVGAPVSWRSALVLESLGATARGIAFFVPGGLGVQEGALVAFGRHLGLPFEAVLMLGLIKRLREVVVGAPGLVAWLLAARRSARPLPPSNGQGSGEPSNA